MQNHNRLTAYILLGLIAGILVGGTAHQYMPDPTRLVETMSLITTLFLRLIKMIIAPLVFSTLVVGIAKMGNIQVVGRIGGKTMAWFIIASLISLTLGLIMVNILRPGDALTALLPAADSHTNIASTALSLKEFITHLVPTSVIDGMAKNEILQIVIFSLFFGCAAAAIGQKTHPLIDIIENISQIMLKITGYVMIFAPIAVFAAVVSATAQSGAEILYTYGVFMGGFYISIVLLWIILLLLGFIFIRQRVFTLIHTVREPILLAFSTASSEAAYPKTLERLEHFGIQNRIAAFVLPMGYSFNLDGSMMYCAFASIFIAQAYGIELSAAQQISMLLILMLTSKGMAGVPRASLVVIAATLGQFNIPEAGLLLLLGVDHFLDMARSATNVVGNSIATAVIAKWENSLTDPDHSSSQ